MKQTHRSLRIIASIAVFVFLAVSCAVASDYLVSNGLSQSSYSASATYGASFPYRAFDDNLTTTWTCASNTGWIEVNLGKVFDLSRVVLVVNQDPAGVTVHDVYYSQSPIGAFGAASLAQEFSGATGNYNVLNGAFPAGTLAQYVQIRTTLTPSWVSWYEVQVYAYHGRETGSLRVNIQPTQAAANNTKWRRVGTTTWFASGETESNIPVGEYSVEFSDATGWIKPATQTVNIASGQMTEIGGAYTPAGDLCVNILPALAVTQNGQWRRVGTTTWFDGGATETGIPVGSYNIEFKKIPGWSAPVTRTVTIAQAKTTLTTGTYHDFHLVAWGDNTHGQCAVPSDSGYVAVACSDYYATALKLDGSLVVWGTNAPNLPSPNSGFVSISGGNSHSMGLRSDGSLAGWGDNASGQITVPSPNSYFTAVACGKSFSVGLQINSSVVAWGANTFGQLNAPQKISFTAIACGESHSLGLKSNGSIVGWGNNIFGQINLPSSNYDFTAVACGDNHSLALTSGGSVVCWGDNHYGQCDVPSPNSGFVSISGGRKHSVGLKSDGSIAVWGGSASTGLPSPNSGFIAVDAGPNYNVAIRAVDCGTLCVTIQPDEAVAAGAKWRRAGTSIWYASGETEYDIPVGSYTIELSDLAGWTKPSPTAIITANKNTACAATYTALTPITLPDAKKSADGTPIYITGAIISAAWPDVFYIESDNRASGIRVEKAAHGLICGNRADIVGKLGTNANGERFIQASSAVKTGDGSVKPLGMTNKQIGGSALLLQLGVAGGSGLNNIGLLVRTWGRVVDMEQVTAPNQPTWFKIDDGSGRSIKCISESGGPSIDLTWLGKYVVVTGISSCEYDASDLTSVIRLLPGEAPIIF